MLLSFLSVPLANVKCVRRVNLCFIPDAFSLGTVFMPPKWSLGYQQCRWSYDSAVRVLEVSAMDLSQIFHFIGN
ncbi:hypothetical protein CK203_043364 [Vitis vinifera]|uniref:Glycoside hydrolase family 31 TIM barrel domain-containing protein n=1 Tax=Vitis vinifera TaxID=29760 RepID=A0A438IAN5_VITVI|nr:hypothetical protein CK203_043364 [Vitis vinifera]